ncbi:MAG: Smr/MutS family protein [Pseudomonadota bacterium]
MPRRRKLSDADKAIWAEVQKSVAPLKPNPPRPVLDAVAKTPSLHPEISDPVTVPNFRIGEKAVDRPSVGFQPDYGRTSPVMDRKNYQRLLKGKKDIDQTVDLHGMTLDHAKVFVTSRLMAAYNSGHRLVLVVTGKGNRTTQDEFNRPKSGVLRQNLPDWCAHAPLSSIVLQVVHAQQKHGGTGAYYVYLRRAR